MKCVYDTVALSQYLDHDLPEADMTALSVHLEECQSCRRELVRLRTAIVIMKSAEQVAPTRDYMKAVMIMHEKN